MFDDVKNQTLPPPEQTPSGGGSSFQESPAGVGASPRHIEVPPGAQKPKSDTQKIHVMPSEYYGVAPKTSVKKIQQVEPVKPVPSPPPPPPPKPAPPKPIKPSKKKIPFILIIGVVFIVVIGVGGFLLLRSLNQPAPEPPIVVEPPQPQILPPPPPPPLPPPELEPIRPGIDSDSDGLTDREEQLIYHSNPRNSDTDGDSFIDGNEVLHLYDPTEAFSVGLALPVYRQVGFGFSLFVPESWSATPPALGEGGEVMFSIPTGETIIIIGVPREGVSEFARTFAADQFPDEIFESYLSKGGFTGIRSEDGRMIILQLPGRLLVATYVLGDVRIIEFLRTFEMMMGSIHETSEML